jgi:hypothetical protein
MEKIQRAIHEYFGDDFTRYKNPYSKELVDYIAEKFKLQKKVAQKFIMDTIKGFPEDISEHYQEFLEYAQNYEKKLGRVPDKKFFDTLLVKMTETTDNKESAKLFFLFEYMTDVFNRAGKHVS